MFTGVIAKIDSQMVTLKNGPRAGSQSPTYFIEMASGEVFGCGWKKPPANVGDTVSFEHSFAYGKQQIDMKTFTRGAGGISSAASAAAGSPATAVRSGPSYNRDRQFPVPLLHGDRSIVRQNALAHAARLVSSGYCMDGTVTSLTPEKMSALVIEMARKFEAYSCGDDEREEAEKRMKE